MTRLATIDDNTADVYLLDVELKVFNFLLERTHLLRGESGEVIDVHALLEEASAID